MISGAGESKARRPSSSAAAATAAKPARQTVLIIDDETQLFWLALTFIPLLLILWKVALPKVGAVLAARAARIAGDLERAAKLRDEAKDVLERYEATLKEAHATARDSLRATAQALAAESARRHAELAHSDDLEMLEITLPAEFPTATG